METIRCQTRAVFRESKQIMNRTPEKLEQEPIWKALFSGGEFHWVFQMRLGDAESCLARHNDGGARRNSHGSMRRRKFSRRLLHKEKDWSPPHGIRRLHGGTLFLLKTAGAISRRWPGNGSRTCFC
jgi:hypothetical protein